MREGVHGEATSLALQRSLYLNQFISLYLQSSLYMHSLLSTSLLSMFSYTHLRKQTGPQITHFLGHATTVRQYLLHQWLLRKALIGCRRFGTIAAVLLTAHFAAGRALLTAVQRQTALAEAA